MNFFLNLFTGPRVRFAGLVLTLAGAFLVSEGIAGTLYVAGLAVAVVSTYRPEVFGWLRNFADPQFWPAFVGFGVAILCAAHHGGLFGLLACIGPLTAYDGMYFEQNY